MTLPPDGTLNVTGTVTGGQSLNLNLAGTATDDKGVAAVRVSLFDGDTSKYLQPNGTLGAAFATRTATLASPNANVDELDARGQPCRRAATGTSRRTPLTRSASRTRRRLAPRRATGSTPAT